MKPQLFISLFAAVGLCWSVSAAAQTFPSGQVRIIVPYPPGGGTDLLARAIAQQPVDPLPFVQGARGPVVNVD